MRHADRLAVFCGMLAALCVGPSTASAQTSLALTYDDGAGNTMPYRLFLPPGHDDPGADFPLVMHLHGAGERGTNNSAQLLFIDGLIAETQGEHPAYLVVPQAPLGARWDNLGADELSTSGRLALEIIEAVEQEYSSADRSRRYVTGLSLGGFGTWDLIGKRPDFFDTAFPLSGFGDPAKATEYLDTRIWTFHGATDRVVPVVPKRETVAAIRDEGGDVIYSEVNGGHGIWRPIYDDPVGELYDWLFDGVAPELAVWSYDPSDGTVRVDASKAPGGSIDSFRYIVNRLDVFDVPETVIVDGVEVATSEFFLATNIRELIYSNRGVGFTGVLEIPELLPEGLDFLELMSFTSQHFYFSPETGDNRRAFDVQLGVFIPEPSSAVLAFAAAALAVRRLRR